MTSYNNNYTTGFTGFTFWGAKDEIFENADVVALHHEIFGNGLRNMVANMLFHDPALSLDGSITTIDGYDLTPSGAVINIFG